MNKTKGWKCFDSDLKCRGHQFEIGKTYEVTGALKMCANGWHFHENGYQLFDYYTNSTRSTRVCEIEAEEYFTEGNKSVCRRIKILREISLIEICKIFGYGDGDGYGDGKYGDLPFSTDQETAA